MQTGVEFRTRFIQVDILIPDVFFTQGVYGVIQDAQIANSRICTDIRGFKVKARQSQVKRQAAKHRADGGGRFWITNASLLAERVPFMNLVFIQPDDAINRHRLQVANKRLNARQAARTPRDQQNIAAVM